MNPTMKLKTDGRSTEANVGLGRDAFLNTRFPHSDERAKCRAYLHIGK